MKDFILFLIGLFTGSLLGAFIMAIIAGGARHE